MDATVSHSHKLGHTSDPVPGRSMSPIGILALSHSHTVVSSLPSPFPAPLHRPGNSYGISKFSPRQQPPLAPNSADIQFAEVDQLH